jgi:hypothetical protein
MSEMTVDQILDATSGEDAPSVSKPRALRWRLVLKVAAAAALSIILIASVACLLLIQLGYPRLQGPIETKLMRPAAEQSYTARLPRVQGWPGLFAFQSDGSENPRTSSLQLFEDGVKIGPPHTAHTVIATDGGGAYSHWGDRLYFSSTRGDDPRTNGREYRIVVPYTPAAWILPVLLTIAVVSGVALIITTARRTAFNLLRVTFRRLRWLTPYAIYAATVASILAIVIAAVGDFRQVQKLEPGDIAAEQGHGYVAKIPVTNSPIPFLTALRSERDTTSAPFVRLLQDGKEVGLPRSRTTLIQSLGAGRYSVTGANIRFSTPDNSDPRTNGRSYAVQERLGLLAGFNIAVFVLIVVSLILLARKRAKLVLWSVSAAAAIGGVIGVLSRFDLITHDEYVSQAKVFHVVDNTYTFQVSGNVAPFVSAAPVGAATAVGAGGVLIACESKPQSLTDLAKSGRGVCAPRDSGLDVDVAFPRALGESAAPEFYRYPIRVHWYAIIALFLASAIFLLVLRFRPTPRQAVGGMGVLAGGLGGLLIAANIAGMFLPMRAEMPEEFVQGIRQTGPRLPYDQALQRLAFLKSDTAESYARRANLAVFESMIHGDVSTDLGRWRLEIPPWKNWSLHALGAMSPSLRKYRYWDHEQEFERGIGLCGNLSSILVGYLAENGIPARIVGLEGHVVVTAEVRPGVWYILDPDYGVVMPYALDQVQQNPGLVVDAYKPSTDEQMLGMIVSYYASAADNYIDQTGRDGFYSSWDGSADIYRSREQLMEQLKWLVPSVLLAAGLLLGLVAFFWRARRRQPQETDPGALAAEENVDLPSLNPA